MEPRREPIDHARDVFRVIAPTYVALMKAGQEAEASEFVERAFNCRSYDEVLRLAGDRAGITGPGDRGEIEAAMKYLRKNPPVA